MSGEYPVDESGMVVFPMLGPKQVARESVVSLRDKLIAEYQKYLRNPSIDIAFLRRINVLGSVQKPGLYTVDATMRLADALALAGGTSPDGDRRRLQLLRDGHQIAVRIADTTSVAALSLQSGDQLFVPERSWASRNPGIIASVISASASLLIALTLR
jgi:polysaccharide export outer membrane protein